MRPTRIQVTFDAREPARLARFWAAALGYAEPEPGTGDWFVIEDPSGVSPRLAFQRVHEAKIVKNRVHLDVQAPGGGTHGDRRSLIDAEAERLVTLGAQPVRSVTDESGYFVVLQDPERNEFCVD